MNTSLNKRIMWLCSGLILPLFAFSEGQVNSGTTYFSNALFNTLIGLIVFLLIVVVALSRALKNLAQSDYLINKIKTEKESEKNNGPSKTTMVLLLSGLALSANAQNAGSNDWLVGGLDMFTFFFLIGVIVIEIIFLILLLNTLHYMLKPKERKTAEVEVKKEKSILDKLNASVDLDKEEDILMDHEYDGIRELNNDLPPWWKYGFYLTIVIAIIYLSVYHIASMGDLQIAEYNKEVEQGKAQVAEYMKNAANNVDETTVKMMEGNDLVAGKETFINVCAACHGRLGEGGVGPNLTDEYWLHGGSLVDIFKTVKYGWPDKGMKSWKEDLSPVQIAQVASFIRTLKGTNPPKAKAAQGDLYIEKGVQVIDSLKPQVDSIQGAIKPDSLKTVTPEK